MDRHSNGILESAVRQAVEKLAEKGVEGCTTKDIILASFGCLSLNGGVATSGEMKEVRKEIRKATIAIISTCISVLIAIVCVLIFL